MRRFVNNLGHLRLHYLIDFTGPVHFSQLQFGHRVVHKDLISQNASVIVETGSTDVDIGPVWVAAYSLQAWGPWRIGLAPLRPIAIDTFLHCIGYKLAIKDLEVIKSDSIIAVGSVASRGYNSELGMLLHPQDSALAHLVRGYIGGLKVGDGAIIQVLEEKDRIAFIVVQKGGLQVEILELECDQWLWVKDLVLDQS